MVRSKGQIVIPPGCSEGIDVSGYFFQTYSVQHQYSGSVSQQYEMQQQGVVY